MGFDLMAEDGIRRHTMSLELLAETIYAMEPDEEIHFKILPQCKPWGITRLERFGSTFFFLCYLGGQNMAILDVTSHESPQVILDWLGSFLQIAPGFGIIPLSKDDLNDENRI